MKIVFFSTHFWPIKGGAESVALNMAAGLVKKGHDVYVITSHKDLTIKNKVDHEFYEEKDGIKIYRFHLRSVFKFKFILIWNRTLQTLTKNADIIYLNDIRFMLPYIIFLKFRLNCKIILNSHGFIFHNSNWLKRKLFFTIGIKLLEFFDSIVCVSKQDYNEVKSILKNVILFENGFNPIENETDSNEYFRNKSLENYILYWGRIDENKGIDDFIIELFDSRFFQKFDGFKFVVIGKISKAIENKIRKILIKNTVHYEDKIVFLGELNNIELRQWIKNSFALVFPSRYEGFGLTLLEGMYFKKPCLVNKIDAYEDIASPEEVIFFDMRIKNSFLNQFYNLSELIKNQDEIVEQMLNKAYSKACAYLWQNKIDALEKILITNRVV